MIQIIFLNGPSSVGKTTIARALQQRMEEHYLLIGIDTIIDMMPEKINDWQTGKKTEGFSMIPFVHGQHGMTLYKTHAGPFAIRMESTLKELVKTLAQLKHFIIIDEVSLGFQAVQEWKNALHDYSTLWVGLTAPIEILEERAIKRANRKLGLAAWHFDSVHNGVTYDLMLDTSTDSIEQLVDTIAMRIIQAS
jgi:chloramphenicol 3-O phosphotransferase